MGGLVVVLRRGLFFLVLGSLAWAQQSTFQRILFNVTGPTISPVVRNIGQGSHQVTLYVTNTSGTCSGSAQLEYSYDGIVFVPFPVSSAVVPFSVASPGLSTFLVAGQGVYPQVRLNLTAFSGGVCTLTAQYTGAQAGSGALQSTTSTGVFTQPYTAFSGSTTAVATVPSAGQNLHQLFGTLINNGANTCGPADGWHIILYGLTNPSGVGPPTVGGDLIDEFVFQGGTGPAGFGPFFGFGIFPIYNIDIFSQGSGSTNCILNLWYSGVPNGPILPTSSSVKPSGLIRQCPNSRNLSVAGGATSVVVPGGGNNGSVIVICQMILTTAAAGSTIATVSPGTFGTNCGTLAAPLGTYDMSAGVPITIGAGLGFGMVVPAHTDLCVGATMNPIVGSVLYDYAGLPPP